MTTEYLNGSAVATGEAQGSAPAEPASRQGVPAPRRLRRPGWRWPLALIIPLGLIALWIALTSTGAVPPHRLPSPTAVFESGVDLAERGLLGHHIAISVQRVAIGFAIGSIAGLALGAIVGLSRVGSHLFTATIGALRAVPSLAWVPLLILYMQYGEDSKITLVAIGALFPVYTNVAGALRHVDRQLVEAGRAFGYRGLKLFATVQLPAIVPSIVSGLRLALAQAWLFLVAAELVGSTMGLGFLLVESQGNMRTDRIFLTIVVLAVLGKATDALIGLFERWLLRHWG